MIELILLSATDPGSSIEDWIMRVFASVSAGLIIWLIKQRADDKKKMQSEITENHEAGLLSDQKFTLYEKFRTKKEEEFSKSLINIEAGLKILITDVNDLKVTVAKISK